MVRVNALTTYPKPIPRCALEDVLADLASAPKPAPGVVDMRGALEGFQEGLVTSSELNNAVTGSVTAYGIIHDFRLMEHWKMVHEMWELQQFPHVHMNEEGIMVFRLFDWFDTVTEKWMGKYDFYL